MELNPRVVLGIEGVSPEILSEDPNIRIDLFSSYLEEAVEKYTKDQIPEAFIQYVKSGVMELPEQTITEISQAVIDFARILMEIHSRKFVTLTEHNDWEGETWSTFILWEGNEEALKRLTDILNYETEDFLLSLELIPEYEVNLLSNNSDCGYMSRYSVTDRLISLDKLAKLEEELVGHEKGSDQYQEIVSNVLYKAGIWDLLV